ncbi:hypothetical protein BASA81_001131 [Batrachochytrium salamandrivorans]|nr:hypothetical protein BASA81_001131 [Batrachochytrium salamandrivorans]
MLQEVELFSWKEHVLNESEVAVDSTSSPLVLPTRLQGGGATVSSTNQFLIWRSFGSIMDLALVSLADSPARQQRLRFGCAISSATALFHKQTPLLLVCTVAGEVIHLFPFQSSPVQQRYLLKLPPTTTCFAPQSGSLWAGFQDGTACVVKLGAKTRPVEFDLQLGGGMGSWLKGWVGGGGASAEAIAQLVPCLEDEDFCLVVSSHGCAKLLQCSTARSSTLVKPWNGESEPGKCLSFYEGGEGDNSRVSFACFKPNGVGEAVAVHWDKASLLGLVGSFGKQADLIHSQSGVLARWNSTSQQSLVQVDAHKLVRIMPKLLLEDECFTVQDVFNATAVDFSPDQLDQALQSVLPTTAAVATSAKAREMELAPNELNEFTMALNKVWLRDQEILQVLPRHLNALLNRQLVPVVRRGGLGVIIQAYTMPTAVELQVLTPVLKELDFHSVESLLKSSRDLLLGRTPPSLVVMNLASQLLALPIPNSSRVGEKVGANAWFLAHLLLEHAKQQTQVLQLLAAWFAWQQDAEQCAKLFIKWRQVFIVPKLIRQAFAQPNRSGAIYLDSALFIRGEAPLFPPRSTASAVVRGEANEDSNSFVQWSHSSNLSMLHLGHRDLPQHLLNQFCPEDVNQAMSITWQLARRPAEYESLKLVCAQLAPSQRTTVLQGLAMLFEHEISAAKSLFHNAMPEGSESEGAKYFQAVAGLFHSHPETSFFFCELALYKLTKNDSDGEGLRELAFETSLLLPTASETMKLIETDLDVQRQRQWLHKLVDNLLRKDCLHLLLQLEINTVELVFATREVLFHVVPIIFANHHQQQQFLTVYAFFIAKGMFESAAQFAYLAHLRCSQGEMELNTLSLTLAALASIPSIPGVEIAPGEVVSVKELQQLFAFLSCKLLFKVEGEIDPASLYSKMLQAINYHHHKRADDAFPVALLLLAKEWHFPVDEIFLHLDDPVAARRLLKLHVPKRADQVHIALQLVLAYSPQKVDQAWVDLFYEWHSLAVLIEFASSKLGLWFTATEIASRYVDHLYEHEVCFPVFDRLLARAERFALHTEEAEHVRDVRSARDAHQLKLSAQALQHKLNRLAF